MTGAENEEFIELTEKVEPSGKTTYRFFLDKRASRSEFT